MPRDETLKFIRWKFKTVNAACVLSCTQGLVALLSLIQHIISLVDHNTIFKCSFNETTIVEENITFFLQADYIIYDYGLFHYLWKINECIALHMDGGYMRCAWCVSYLLACGAMFITTISGFSGHGKNSGNEGILYRCTSSTVWLYPLLTLQSTYCICILILTFSALPKLLKILSLKGTSANYTQRLAAALAFVFGAVLNYYLNYVIWHYYWHMEWIVSCRQRNQAYIEAAQRFSNVPVDENPKGVDGEKDKTSRGSRDGIHQSLLDEPYLEKIANCTTTIRNNTLDPGRLPWSDTNNNLYDQVAYFKSEDSGDDNATLLLETGTLLPNHRPKLQTSENFSTQIQHKVSDDCPTGNQDLELPKNSAYSQNDHQDTSGRRETKTKIDSITDGCKITSVPHINIISINNSDEIVHSKNLNNNCSDNSYANYGKENYNNRTKSNTSTHIINNDYNATNNSSNNGNNVNNFSNNEHKIKVISKGKVYFIETNKGTCDKKKSQNQTPNRSRKRNSAGKPRKSRVSKCYKVLYSNSDAKTGSKSDKNVENKDGTANESINNHAYNNSNNTCNNYNNEISNNKNNNNNNNNNNSNYNHGWNSIDNQVPSNGLSPGSHQWNYRSIPCVSFSPDSIVHHNSSARTSNNFAATMTDLYSLPNSRILPSSNVECIPNRGNCPIEQQESSYYINNQLPSGNVATQENSEYLSSNHGTNRHIEHEPTAAIHKSYPPHPSYPNWQPESHDLSLHQYPKQRAYQRLNIAYLESSFQNLPVDDEERRSYAENWGTHQKMFSGKSWPKLTGSAIWYGDEVNYDEQHDSARRDRYHRSISRAVGRRISRTFRNDKRMSKSAFKSYNTGRRRRDETMSESFVDGLNYWNDWHDEDRYSECQPKLYSSNVHSNPRRQRLLYGDDYFD